METGTAEVVIVGAGPTGLLLAIELALAGVRASVIERLSEPDQTIKAGAIGPLAGEALERRGLRSSMEAVEEAAARAMAAMAQQTGGQPTQFANILRRVGGHFSGLFLIDQTRQRQPDRRLRGIRQQALEGMLSERARELGVDLRRGHELIDFHENAQGVHLDVRGPDGLVGLRCAYLIGCDGGRSRIRTTAGFEFPGTDPTITGHQAIVELDDPNKLLPLGWRRTATGMLAYGPVPGRVLTVEFDGAPADREAPVTAEEIERSLRHVSGTDVRVTAVKTATRFTDHARQASSYRRGRILLAGDAAHVHSPFGGQGLNLGLLDAVNLGWKLAAVVRGRAHVDLLDTYTTERHPVAERVLSNTRAQVALMRPDVLTTALREVIADIMRLDEGNRFFGEMVSGITTRYALGDEHPLVGTLCGDARMSVNGRETSLFDLMCDGGGVLVDNTDGRAAAVAGPWATHVRCAQTSAATSMLVRPDGCVAWAATEGTDGLQSALERWFGTSGT